MTFSDDKLIQNRSISHHVNYFYINFQETPGVYRHDVREVHGEGLRFLPALPESP
jgi:hypothetical protein